MQKILIWALFVLNTIGISTYLICAGLGTIEAPKYFLWILLVYGIFTTMIFGDLVLKPKSSGNNKRV